MTPEQKERIKSAARVRQLRPDPTQAVVVMERWMMGDPFLVLQRKQERAARTKQGKAAKAKQQLANLFKEPTLDQDTSERIEQLLMTWHNHERAYMPSLGAPRVSPSCRGHDAGDVHDDADDRDAKLERITAEAVASCVDQLPQPMRSAIGVHCRNKAVGAAVHKNPRIEDQHRAYQEAKDKLWPLLKKRGML